MSHSREPAANSTLCLAGRLALNIEIERTIGIEGELVPIAKGKAVDRIGREALLFRVHRQRPEGLYRWDLVLVEMQNVTTVAPERLALGIAERCRIDGVFDRVGAETEKRRSRPRPR